MFQDITSLQGSQNNPPRKEERFNTSVQQRLLLELNSLSVRESNHTVILDITTQRWATLVLLLKTLFAPLLPSFSKTKLLSPHDLLLKLSLSPDLRGDSSTLVRMRPQKTSSIWLHSSCLLYQNSPRNLPVFYCIPFPRHVCTATIPHYHQPLH